MANEKDFQKWYGTTIVSVRKKNEVVVAGDGQVTLGDTVIKANAKKVRILADGKVITGFAGATADAFALFERLESKLEKFSNNLMRACVEMAKDWRTDRYLRRLEAMMIVADKESKILSVCSGTAALLKINIHVLSGDNHNPMNVEQVNRYLNKCLTIFTNERDDVRSALEGILMSLYALSLIHI